ncbi:MAG: NAD-dependent deacylase [Dinghuibacter sp.]|nr:NAD-dependent deacylase [Dinghuibacter sp.]
MKNLVVLTGAGISAESGLKTFRDTDGLWEGYDVYEVATPQGWSKNPALVLEFYNQRRKDVRAAQPNRAHQALAELEEQFTVTIITQNIDDLHERAGSTNIVHLHGEIFKMRSEKSYSPVYQVVDEIKMGDLAPDGAQLRPHIVWFGEAVPEIERAARIMETADLFILAGTSLQVYPAAGLMEYLPDETPKYIVDKKIPPVEHYRNVIPVEQPATEGMEWVKKQLLGV